MDNVVNTHFKRQESSLRKKGTLSKRVFPLCAPKIRKTSEGFNSTVATLNMVNPKFVEPEREVKVTHIRAKRTLPTSVTTPERSPGQRKKPELNKVRKKQRGEEIIGITVWWPNRE